MERKRTIEDARYFVSPSPWEGVGRLLFFIVLTVITVLAAIFVGKPVGYIIAAGVELLWVFLVSRAKDNERRIDDENTLVLYGPEGEELLDDFTTGELFYENKLILGQKFLFGYHIGPIIKIRDIRAVYLKIYKRGFFETRRYLVCEVKQADGSYEDVSVARPGGRKLDPESEKVIGILRERNPAIQLGKTR